MCRLQAFILVIFSLVALDGGIFHRRTRTIAFKEALILSGVWIGVALAFNVLIFVPYVHHCCVLDLVGDGPDGRAMGVLLLSRYRLPNSIRAHHLFLIAMIFSYFRIPT